jgi:hypothetical protein
MHAVGPCLGVPGHPSYKCETCSTIPCQAQGQAHDSRCTSARPRHQTPCTYFRCTPSTFCSTCMCIPDDFDSRMHTNTLIPAIVQLGRHGVAGSDRPVEHAFEHSVTRCKGRKESGLATRASTQIYSGSATRYRATTTKPGLLFSGMRDERRACMRDSETKRERGGKSGRVKKLVKALGWSEKATYC